VKSNGGKGTISSRREKKGGRRENTRIDVKLFGGMILKTGNKQRA